MADSNSPYRIIAAADASTLEKLVNELVKQNAGFRLVGMVAASGPNAELVVALENERKSSILRSHSSSLSGIRPV